MQRATAFRVEGQDTTRARGADEIERGRRRPGREELRGPVVGLRRFPTIRPDDALTCAPLSLAFRTRLILSDTSYRYRAILSSRRRPTGRQGTERLKSTLEGIVLALISGRAAYGYEITA